MKDKQQQTNQSENTLTEIFKYEVEAGVSEYHVMIHATRPEATYEEQLNAVVDTTANCVKVNYKVLLPSLNATF